MKPRLILVVGCGRLGRMLANQLSLQGERVVVIDRDPERLSSLSVEFSGFEVQGDAVEMSILRQADIEQADCLLAATGKDNVNLMVAQIARHIFHVPLVIARVYDPGRESVYHHLGVEVINPVHLSAQTYLETLNSAADRRRQ